MSQKKSEQSEKRGSIRDETKKSVFAILFFTLSLFFALAGIKKAGVIGNDLYTAFSKLLGVGYFLIPSTLLILSISFFRNIKNGFVWPKIISSGLFLISSLALTDLTAAGNAGLIGEIITRPLVNMFDFWGSYLLVGSAFIVSLLITFDISIKIPEIGFPNLIKNFSFKKREEEIKLAGGNEEETEENAQIETYSAKEIYNNNKTAPANVSSGFSENENSENNMSAPANWALRDETFSPPPLSILERDKGKPDVGDIKANANIIKRTLQNFGIVVEMDEVTIGPTVTRYALKPAEGVKLSRIVALQSDLAMALAAHPIRIEAPIPGKALVGIEIPNNIKATVSLGNLLSNEEFQNSDKSLLVALGKSISGKSHFANLSKMPHLLIAGTTGSGKSVSIHSIVTSLLYRNSPQNLRLIMIDPKRVELTLYNKIPHLLTPVITEAKKAILALRWAGKEMERRYDILESESVRDIESYHKTVLAPALEKIKKGGAKKDEDGTLPEAMPYIVIVIDELADIMSTFPRELEGAIVRLAQMSRAVGIHLILSTQRPSVNVITGLIKANIPARIALQVASQIDSRTILDMPGAEKLLGSGDMLYLSGEMSQPQRIQSPFISENEVKKVTKFLKDQSADDIPDEINLGSVSSGVSVSDDSFESGEEDDLYEAAREEIIKAGKASTSYLQRRLGVGYARAAKLIDMLEERGVVGKAEGNKPREVVGARNQDYEENDQKEPL